MDGISHLRLPTHFHPSCLPPPTNFICLPTPTLTHSCLHALSYIRICIYTYLAIELISASAVNLSIPAASCMLLHFIPTSMTGFITWPLFHTYSYTYIIVRWPSDTKPIIRVKLCYKLRILYVIQ